MREKELAQDVVVEGNRHKEALLALALEVKKYDAELSAAPVNWIAYATWLKDRGQIVNGLTLALAKNMVPTEQLSPAVIGSVDPIPAIEQEEEVEAAREDPDVVRARQAADAPPDAGPGYGTQEEATERFLRRLREEEEAGTQEEEQEEERLVPPDYGGYSAEQNAATERFLRASPSEQDFQSHPTTAKLRAIGWPEDRIRTAVFMMMRRGVSEDYAVNYAAGNISRSQREAAKEIEGTFWHTTSQPQRHLPTQQPTQQTPTAQQPTQQTPTAADYMPQARALLETVIPTTVNVPSTGQYQRVADNLQTGQARSGQLPYRPNNLGLNVGETSGYESDYRRFSHLLPTQQQMKVGLSESNRGKGSGQEFLLEQEDYRPKGSRRAGSFSFG